jgi:uncharacterized protein
VRAVLDPNVLISALLSRTGAPARVVALWLNGAFELLVSPILLEELERALTYPKLRDRISQSDAAAAVDLFKRSAVLAADPAVAAGVTSRDPDDDCLIALAEAEHAVVVSGDRALLALRDRVPVQASSEFLASLEGHDSTE